MSIKTITTDELRYMTDKEALIIQGCGGDLNEWVDGINDMLTEDGILQKKTKFDADNVRTFQHNKCTCLLFPFDESVKLSMGLLSLWRIRTHEQFCGTWLSDFVPNSLGGFYFQEERNQDINMNRNKFEEMTEKLYTADTHTSPDFQCDQSGGYPVSLCVNWEESKAWLAPNYALAGSGEDMSEVEQACADFGIRQCCDNEQFNGILHELGEDAFQSAELYDEDEGQAMEL